MTNMSKFTKDELMQMANKRCKHWHTYLEHPNCWIKDKRGNLKIGYLDIEAGGFNANWDYTLTWVIKTRDKEEYLFDVIKQEDILSFDFDKKIIKSLIEALQQYDVIYTYYGTKYDIPFLRTRALSHKLIFPHFGSIRHKDVYYMVKAKMRIHKNSLESACAILNIRGKNHVKGNLWMRAKIGDPKTLEYVLSHNKKDCQILEKLHKRLEEYAKDTNRSI